ncbi:MAG: protease modulator HflC [Candidatus Omnitrophica bacterium]|nr:protease modulator HflC [Candidatus Omnitrophota bacterium]
MKRVWLPLLIVAATLAGFLLLNSLYLVSETDQAVVTEFGRPIGAPIQKAGLHWKTPFIQHVHYFDKRILEWDGYPSEIPSKDKKFIWVDVTARWRIIDPLKFLQSMRHEMNAQSRLDDILDGIARDHVTRYEAPEIVRNTNRILKVEAKEEDISAEETFETIRVGRNTITRHILEQARKIVSDYGIELVDVRIKRISYIESVQKRVFERMISERKRAAEKLRSEGQAIRAEIEGQKERELKRIYSEAYRKAQELKGKADAEATAIYAQAYSKDPEFYTFLTTLESYREGLKESRLILSTKSDFLTYLKSIEKKTP